MLAMENDEIEELLDQIKKDIEELKATKPKQ